MIHVRGGRGLTSVGDVAECELRLCGDLEGLGCLNGEGGRVLETGHAGCAAAPWFAVPPNQHFESCTSKEREHSRKIEVRVRAHAIIQRANLRAIDFRRRKPGSKAALNVIEQVAAVVVVEAVVG